jgi:hypothetical protein
MDPVNQILKGIFTDQTRVLFIVGALLIVMTEIGYRISQRLMLSNKTPQLKQTKAVQASIIGLMGLLLAFTFTISLQRFDHRQELAQLEADAIGTAYLRTAFLPDKMRMETKNLFRQYLMLRLQRSKAMDYAELEKHENELAKIQQQIWQGGVVGGRENPNPMMANYVVALNAMIDLDSDRLAASRHHVPGPVWLLLLLLTSAGCWCVGYLIGAMGKRSLLPQLVLPLLLTITITLITDLDRPRHGLIGLDETGLHDLARIMGDALD